MVICFNYHRFVNLYLKCFNPVHVLFLLMQNGHIFSQADPLYVGSQVVWTLSVVFHFLASDRTAFTFPAPDLESAFSQVNLDSFQ